MPMTLIFSGQDEKLEFIGPKGEFLNLDYYSAFIGQCKEQMPLLISGKDADGNVVDVPRIPVSCAHVIERRETAPADVIDEWRQNQIYTNDGIGYGIQGEVLIALDAQPLREINSQSIFNDGALVLSDEQWNDLKARNDVLSLTWDEVDEVNGQYGTGYIKKSGVWVPANKTVAKVWDYLGRGRDLKEYAQLVDEHCNYYPTGDKDVMRLLFNQSYRSDDDQEEIFPIMRCWYAGEIRGGSVTSENTNLNDFGIALLIGTAPNLTFTSEKTLEARLAASPNAGIPSVRETLYESMLRKIKRIKF